MNDFAKCVITILPSSLIRILKPMMAFHTEITPLVVREDLANGPTERMTAPLLPAPKHHSFSNQHFKRPNPQKKRAHAPESLAFGISCRAHCLEDQGYSVSTLITPTIQYQPILTESRLAMVGGDFTCQPGKRTPGSTLLYLDAPCWDFTSLVAPGLACKLVCSLTPQSTLTQFDTTSFADV